MGSFWGRFRDEWLLEGLVHEQLTRKIYEAGSAKIHPGDVVLDVGSHLGTFTQFALNKGARLVVAFEPEPTNITCFKKTFESEIRETQIILIEAAAWESPSSLRFKLEATDNTGMGKVTEAGDLVVPAVTIDETVERLGLHRVDFVKMDIEGSERHALKGAHGTLSRFGPRMAVSIYHRPDDPEVISQVVLKARPSYQQLEKAGFAYFY
jgi:FkbM family methyltransferase